MSSENRGRSLWAGHCVPAPRAKVRTREFDGHPEKEEGEKAGKSQLERVVEAGRPGELGGKQGRPLRLRDQGPLTQ